MSDNVFHDHLDVCPQCEKNPMTGMCAEGVRLLHLQATGHDPGPQPVRKNVDIVEMMSAVHGYTPEEAALANKIIDDLGFGAVFGR